jgi:hypothetical protein
MQSASHDVNTLIGDVVLHSRLRVNSKLNSLVYRATETAVVLSSIDVVGVVFGVVDVILGTIAAQALGSDLELTATIAKRQKAEHAEEKTDGLRRDRLDGTDVNGLGVVAKPVTEVYAGNHHLVELLASHGTSHDKLEKGVLDITMTPCWFTNITVRSRSDCQFPSQQSGELTILTLNFGDASNITSSEGESGTNEKIEDDYPQNKRIGFGESHDCGFLDVSRTPKY